MTRPSSLHHLFASSAHRAPDSVAVSDGPHRLTRAALDQRADRLAHFLTAFGIGPGCTVALQLTPGAAFAEALLGSWRAGAAVLPLAPGQPLDDLPATVDLVLTTNATAPTWHGPTPVVDLAAEEAAIAAQPATALALPEDPARPAWLGRDPRTNALLLLDHAALANQVDWLTEEFALEAADRVVCAADPQGWAGPLLAALATGATAVIAPADAVLATAAAHRATVLAAAPAALAELATAEGWADCTELRLLLTTGPAPQAETVRQLGRRSKAELCVVHLLAGAVVVTADLPDPEQDGDRAGLGRPIDNVRVLVLDGYGDLAPAGVPGELHLAGPGTPVALPGDPRATARLLRPAPYGPAGSRLYATGDLVRWLGDGSLELLGRADAAPTAPQPQAAPDRPAYTAPATDAERTVARIWSELLEVEPVGADDNFFQLGGYSLILTELARRLHEATGVPLVLADLFTSVTVREQAALLTVEPGQGARTGQDPWPAVTPVPRGRPLPLSSGQRRIWFLDASDPSPEWTSPLFLRLPAGTGPEAVRRALNALADRHEALRTRYVVVDGEPVQWVGPAVPIELRNVDGTREQVVELFREQFETGFELTSGRLWRATLARIPADGEDVLLLVTIHHIACDGWSAAVLEEEFRALLGDPHTVLPEIAVQYPDYAHWQQTWHTRERLAAELAHWRTALEGLVPLELPTDHPRPAKRDPHGNVVTFDIPTPLMAAATSLGQRHEATPFMTLLAAFGAVLARHSGQWDVVIGTPVAGRSRPELERTVGFFLNSLVLRCRLDGEHGFAAALDGVREVCRAAFAHQQLSFEQIVDELRPRRDPSRTPLYQVAFNLHDGRLIGGMPDRADIDYLYPARQVAKTDLTLYVRSEADGTWSGAFEYADALFERATVERLAAHFLRLLGAVTADPQVPLAAVEILADRERTDLAGWSTGEPAAWPAHTTLDLIEAQAAATPEAVAVRADGIELSYRELDERANRIAHHLIAAGAGPDSVVGLCLERGADLVPALLGVWKADAAYLPLDPSLPTERLGHVLADCASPLLLTTATLAATTAAFRGTRILLDQDRDAVAARPADRPSRTGDPELLAYVIYTSGSTGRPKGVMVHHRGLANHLRWAARDLVRGPGGAPLFSSIAFDLPATNLYAPLITGRTVHVLPAELDLSALGATLLAGAPYSFVKLTPGHLELLTEQLTADQADRLAERVLVAGEALPARTANHWLAALGPDRLTNEYGPTEASIGSTVHPVRRPYEGAVPLGHPLPNTTALVLDPAGRPVPVGVAGELHVGGQGLARGYYGRPDLTAERFVPAPDGPPGARLYRTGDLARLLPDGSIDFLGRIDTQVKLRGYRIELGEIEAVLTERGDVRDAVVIARISTTGEKSLVAYLVPEYPELIDPGLVRTELAELLPEYMVPTAFALVERIPLTANGKVDRRALPEIETAAADYRAPATVSEERIADIWAELLGLDRVSVEDSFFELGGHSILAIRMTSRLQDEFDLDLSIGTVFAQPTVRRLAAAIEEQIREEIDRLSDAELAAFDTAAFDTASGTDDSAGATTVHSGTDATNPKEQ